MANPWQSQLQNHNLPVPWAPAFNTKQYFSSSFICLLAHAQVSLATASDRPHIESRAGTDTSHKDLVADDATDINVGDGSNQDAHADVTNSYFPFLSPFLKK